MVAATHSYAVELKPNWSEIEALRQFIGPWVYALVRLPEVRDAVATVSAELLENAVRHGNSELGPIGYRIEVGPDHVRMAVSNRCDRSGHRDPQRVAERVRWIEDFGDSQTAYREQIRRVASGASAGLGLARVAAEGRSRLRCHVRGDVIEVEAITQFQRRPKSGRRLTA